LGSLSASLAQQKTAELIELCLQQFQTITEQRHKLIHRIIYYSDERGFMVSNAQTAKNLLTAELRMLVTREDLKAMRFDCMTISLTLGSNGGDALISEIWKDQTPAWRYIPAPPTPQKPERPAGRRERKRQRRASQRSPGVK
jgi:hypothetical protein